MKKYLLLAWMFSMSIAYAGQAEEDKYTMQIEESVKRMNVLYQKNHLEPLVFETGHLTITRPYNRHRKINIIRFWTSNKMEFEFLPKDNELISFHVLRLRKNDPLYDVKPKPEWTTDRVIAESKRWAEAVLGRFPQNVGKPRTSFVVSMEYPKYYDGEWHIMWPRVDSQGHTFGGDALNIILSEKKGLIAVNLHFVSIFEEVRGETISREEGVKTSRPAAEALLTGDMVKHFLPDGLRLETPTAELWVINANHLLDCKTVDEAVVRTEVTARLAWRVLYPLSGDASGAEHTLEIWVDALNKEILGGDFK